MQPINDEFRSVEIRCHQDPATFEEQQDRSQRWTTIVVCAVTGSILFIAFLLIVISLSLSPTIDERVRKENEEMFRGLSSSGTSTSTESETSNQTMIPSTVHPS